MKPPPTLAQAPAEHADYLLDYFFILHQVQEKIGLADRCDLAVFPGRNSGGGGLPVQQRHLSKEKARLGEFPENLPAPALWLCYLLFSGKEDFTGNSPIL